MSKNSKKKIAFTLTELLVIIVVVAVLAAVTLPKMNKVLEGRKIMEAEQVMAAVRNEQEYRCALDKPYTTQFTQLSQSISTSETPNFNYELSALGMMARRKGATYQLEMPSYADGRLCCDGPGCASLNKDYPSCLDLKRKPDYQPGQTACQGPDPDPEPVGCTTPQPPDDTKECHSPSKPNSCGLVSRSYHCVGTNWVPESYPACENNKPDDEVRPCECGSEVATHTCDEDQHKWVIGNWSGCEVPAIEEEPCGAGFTGTKTRTKVCNTSTGTYDSWGDWDTSACVEGGVCRAFMDKYGYNWDHKCNQINKIKDLTYGGDDINNTNFINKCCKEPTTCSEWVELYASVASTWRSECNANMKIEDNSYHAADVTNENFPEKCCKAFPYELAQDYILKVDYSGKATNDYDKGHGNNVYYFTTTGLNKTEFDSPKSASCANSGAGDACYVEGDYCSWGEHSFNNIESTSIVPEDSAGATPSGDEFCFDCVYKGKCPDPYMTPDSVFSSGGYAYTLGGPSDEQHGWYNHPCDANPGAGDLGHEYPIVCTTQPAGTAGAYAETPTSITSSAGACGGGQGDASSSETSWMDVIAEFTPQYVRGHCNCTHGLGHGTCDGTRSFRYYRPSIRSWKRYRCVGKSV